MFWFIVKHEPVSFHWILSTEISHYNNKEPNKTDFNKIHVTLLEHITNLVFTVQISQYYTSLI